MKLKINPLFVLLLLIPAFVGCSSKPQPAAKYIFLFIGDGMGAPQVGVTESYLSYLEGKQGGEKLTFSAFPVYGVADSYSADAIITDSSAAGTAIASGTKTCNGMVGVAEDGETYVNSFAVNLKQDYGYKVGILSSVPVNHATPASFYGHDRSRGNYYAITTQIPESGFDFFGGSGFIEYSDPHGDDDSEVFLEENGYTVVFGQQEFEKEYEPGKKIVMISNPVEEHRGNTPNYAKQTDTLVTLARMMENCLEVLGDREPFFVMCEGGEIDWECHGHNTMGMVNSIINMDEAIKVAYEFYLKHPKQTLIVVTADHETGGVTLGNQGHFPKWKRIAAGEDDGNNGIGWTTHGHTGNPVPVFAVGRNSGKFTGHYDNTDISRKLLGLE